MFLPPPSQYIYCGDVITEILSYRALPPPPYILNKFSAAILHLCGYFSDYSEMTFEIELHQKSIALIALISTVVNTVINTVVNDKKFVSVVRSECIVQSPCPVIWC